MILTLHPSDTPQRAYDRLMRFGAFILAARVALQFRLGRELLIRALDRAIGHHEELGLRQEATVFAKEHGFTMVDVTAGQLPLFVSALEACENGSLSGSRACDKN